MALESLPKIAPALFSAEQDLIQIYNKKTDTTGVINASLLGGSTPPSGVSGAIQFSNGSAFASDAANFFWDDTNNRLGIGTNTPTGIVQIKTTQANTNGSIVFINNNASTIASITDTGSALTPLQFRGSNFGFVDGSGVLMGGGYGDTPSARLHIKGSGSTSATTSLLVQNSAGSQGLKIADDLGFQIGLLGASGVGYSIRTDNGGGGVNGGINTNFNNGATWIDDTNTRAMHIAYNSGVLFPNTTRYPITIGSATKAVASAQLEMVSTTQGFLPPRMTTTQINAIVSPAEGLVAFNTTISHLCCYQGGAWVKFSHSPM